MVILFAIGSTLLLEGQTEITGLTLGYIEAGFGCSVIFPILLAFLEKEVLDTCSLSNIPNPLGFIETGISLMVGAYLTGIGLVTLFILSGSSSQAPFHWIVILLACIGLLSTYLNWSSSSTKG